MSETRGVGQQRLERAEAEHLVLDVAHEVAPLAGVEDQVLLDQQPLDHLAQLVFQALRRQALHRLQVEAAEQQLVDARLRLLVGARGLAADFRQRLARCGERSGAAAPRRFAQAHVGSFQSGFNAPTRGTGP